MTSDDNEFFTPITLSSRKLSGFRGLTCSLLGISCDRSLLRSFRIEFRVTVRFCSMVPTAPKHLRNNLYKYVSANLRLLELCLKCISHGPKPPKAGPQRLAVVYHACSFGNPKQRLVIWPEVLESHDLWKLKTDFLRMPCSRVLAWLLPAVALTVRKASETLVS